MDLLKSIFSRIDRTVRSSPTLPESNAAVAAEVDAAFWLLLWRAASKADLTDASRALDAGQPISELHARLLGSAECWNVVDRLWHDLDPERPPQAVEAGLRGLGDDERFINLAYRIVLGRDPDQSGAKHYRVHLRDGTSRTTVLRALVRSDEFRARHEALCPQTGFIPRDTQLCELANPAKWANPDWMALMRSLVVVPTDRPSMHRKGYELTQLLFGLQRLGFLRDDVRVLSVGAGHEPVLYWLANRVMRVVATDLYDGVWQTAGAREGDALVLEDPSQYSPFPYRQDHLEFLRMDGTRLEFADESFDVAYSLSSIEHFGGFDPARRAVTEMARVLVPGGVIALSTDYCLSGPPHHEAFQPAEVHALVDNPALELFEPIDELVWRRNEYRAVDLRRNRYQVPHLVVQDLGTEFTSVMIFLRKRQT